jgi:hypothetical protein
MVLRCTCGGPLEIVDGSGRSGEGLHETYKCVECHRRGTFQVTATGRRLTTGCVRRVEP